jgi:hypothetical protein
LVGGLDRADPLEKSFFAPSLGIGPLTFPFNFDGSDFHCEEYSISEKNVKFPLQISDAYRDISTNQAGLIGVFRDMKFFRIIMSSQMLQVHWKIY